MYIIRHNKGLVGCQESGRSYVVGFNSLPMASRVSRVMKVPPNIRFERKTQYDITEDVRNNLKDHNIDSTFVSITIDTRASLFVEKEVVEGARASAAITVDCMEQADFMYLSFEKSLGLIMPYEVQFEDDYNLVLLSSIIDPVVDITEFQKNLRF